MEQRLLRSTPPGLTGSTFPTVLKSSVKPPDSDRSRDLKQEATPRPTRWWAGGWVGCPTCLKRSLVEKFAVCALLLDPAFVVLGARAAGVLRRRPAERGRHLLATQSLPVALLRHLQPELVVDAVVARPHIPVSDDSARKRQLCVQQSQPATDREGGGR